MLMVLLFLTFIIVAGFIFLRIQQQLQQATRRRSRREPLIRAHFSDDEHEIYTDNVLGLSENTTAAAISSKEKPLKKKIRRWWG